MVVCPVKCKYCMASKIDIRKMYWENDNRIGLNKSCLFINRLPNDPNIKDMNFPWHLMDGEYLGFQGITDCFWNIYFEDLKYVIDKVNNSKIKKLILISKIPINEKQLNLIKNNPKILVVYSLTGLDALEQTTTNDRIEAIKRIKENNVDVLPIIHPYIHNYSDISFLPKLKEIGLKYISWKGFRYNPHNMSELNKFIPQDILKQYICNEEEVLIGDEYLKEETSKLGLQYIDLKQYIKRDNGIKGVSKEVAEKQVNELLNNVVISSSEKDLSKLVDYVINRRL